MIRAHVISHEFNTKTVKCLKERKKENLFALWSTALSAKLNPGFVPRVCMYTVMSYFLYRYAEDLPQEYGGTTQVSVYYPPGRVKQNTDGRDGQKW